MNSSGPKTRLSTLTLFSGISVVRYLTSVDLSRTNKTLSRVESLIEAQDVRKSDIIALLKGHLTRFDHHETHKYLDQRM